VQKRLSTAGKSNLAEQKARDPNPNRENTFRLQIILATKAVLRFQDLATFDNTLLKERY
jgi:hypothetical protein